jgi:hypothetical protein
MRAIDICCTDLRLNYTEDQDEGIGLLYHYGNNPTDQIPYPDEINVWKDNEAVLEQIKWCPWCGKMLQVYDK